MLAEDAERVTEVGGLVSEINLGATAIGTGLNAPIGYPQAARASLESITGRKLTTASNLIEATQDSGAFVQVSGVVRASRSSCQRPVTTCGY